MKISHIQLFWTIAIMELGMTLLMTITDSLQAAKQDACISMALAGGISLLVAFISTRLALLYPEQTLVEASETILGSALGKLVVIVYLVQWYTIIPIVLRQFTDLIESMFLQTTPRFPIIGIMIALMIYAIYAGKTAGNRSSQLNSGTDHLPDGVRCADRQCWNGSLSKPVARAERTNLQGSVQRISCSYILLGHSV